PAEAVVGRRIGSGGRGQPASGDAPLGGPLEGGRRTDTAGRDAGQVQAVDPVEAADGGGAGNFGLAGHEYDDVAEAVVAPLQLDDEVGGGVLVGADRPAHVVVLRRGGQVVSLGEFHRQADEVVLVADAGGDDVGPGLGRAAPDRVAGRVTDRHARAR